MSLITERPTWSAPLFDYARALDRREARVTLVLAGSRNDEAELLSWARTECRRRGVDLHVARNATASRPEPTRMLELLLLVFDEPFNLDNIIAAAGPEMMAYSVVSTAFEYNTKRQMDSAANAIGRAKAFYSDRLNVLRPVQASNGRFVVPIDKIVDNMICDTVRVKYRPSKTADDIPRLTNEQVEFFRRASGVFINQNLYHRSPSDGYFAYTAHDGFYITATKTYKESALERLTFVENYDEHTNILYYRGPYLPSSDGVEAAILARSLKPGKGIIHTHASRQFTRNPAWSDMVRVGRMRYGEPELGYAVADGLGNLGDGCGFLIMEDHGEVFVGPAATLPAYVATLAKDPRSAGGTGG